MGNLWPLVATVGCALIVAGIFAAVSVRRLTAYNTDLTIWQDAVVHQPDNAVALVYLANALLNAGREQEADEHFERALPANPAFVQRGWGISLLKTGQLQKALVHLEEATRLRPDVAENHRYLGIALASAGRPQEAIEHLRRALGLVPDVAEVQQYLADVIVDARRTTEAIGRLRKAVQNEPDSAQLHYELGAALYGGGRHGEAIAELEQALRLQADFPAAKNKLEQALRAKQP
jgi:tetratricopeptide (TPR) repeat protein